MGIGPTQKLLTEYRERLALHKAFGTMLERLIGDLLRAAAIKVQPVSHRIKDELSLARKLNGGTYGGLAEVTDVCGVRIVTYFADDVDKVAKLIEGEFKIDKSNSIDKRAAMDPAQFGYLSVHYIVSLTEARAALTEYVAFRGCIAEIQIRSVLQHAWAEIEHDLGYKSELAVPREVIRQFSRLAGLLEVADEGFVALRQRLWDYQIEVDAKIEDKSNELLIDGVSLKALIDSDSNIHEIDKLVREAAQSPVMKMPPESIGMQVTAASTLGFRTVGELKAGIQRDKARIARFGLAFIGARPSGTQAVANGMAVPLFLGLLSMDKGGIDFLKQVFPLQPGSELIAEIGLRALQVAHDSLKKFVP